jgi:type VI secretion system protein ImpH
VTVLEQLEEEAYAFDFYQAVRRLDCAFPDKPQTGQSSRAIDDPMRFGQEASMAFAPATMQSVECQEGRPPRLIQRFFGLLGPQGALPLHLTEYVRERLRNHEDWTLLRFLDVFHHRMTAFFYRAWARVRPNVSFDQSRSDRFSDYVGSLFGLGMRSLTNRDDMPDLPKRHFAGLLSCQTRHADGLLAILSGYFRMPVQIQEFVGQWIELPANCRCLVGLSSATLGVNTTVGSHVWDCQQKFRIIFGPLTLEDFYRMLPGEAHEFKLEEENAVIGDGVEGRQAQLARARKQALPSTASLKRLIAAVRGYIGDQLDWDLQLILRKEDAPPLGLGVGGHLGWSSWVIQNQMERDPDDLVLNAMQVPDDVQRIEYRYVRNWDATTLGQSRDGKYLLATFDADDPGNVYIETSTLQATAG